MGDVGNVFPRFAREQSRGYIQWITSWFYNYILLLVDNL
jgi:hypothetical protein